MQNKKKFFVCIIGVIAVAINIFLLKEAYVSTNDFRLLGLIIGLFYLIGWAVNYLLKWRRELQKPIEENEPFKC